MFPKSTVLLFESFPYWLENLFAQASDMELDFKKWIWRRMRQRPVLSSLFRTSSHI